MLLPLSRGARVVYLDEINGDRMIDGLEAGQITAMIGVPALWELIERRIFNEVRERGKPAEKACPRTCTGPSRASASTSPRATA